MIIQLYFNGQYLPTKTDKQKSVDLHLPFIGKWYVAMRTHIGIERAPMIARYSFIVLGFGITYEENWDE